MSLFIIIVLEEKPDSFVVYFYVVGVPKNWLISFAGCRCSRNCCSRQKASRFKVNFVQSPGHKVVGLMYFVESQTRLLLQKPELQYSAILEITLSHNIYLQNILYLYWICYTSYVIKSIINTNIR